MELEREIDLRVDIETPENVRLAVRLAGPGSRAGAYALDLALRAVLALGAVQATSLLLGTAPAGLPLGVFLVLLFLIEWGYGALFEGLWNGQTPGKRALGLRVVKTEGYAIGFHDAVLRNLLRVVDALPLFYALGLVATLVGPRAQRIGDLAAGTIVVRERRGRLRTPSAALGTVEPFSPTELGARYRPPDRMLDAIEELFRREAVLSPERTEEIARILAPPLARRLGYAGGAGAASREARSFLLRVLKTFHEEPAGTEEDVALRARRGLLSRRTA